ncbi:MAG TPA: DNA polymerase I [Lacipirellulaceae bacterium]|nr:DNA polymerase I [Lacipirellulaceae bacterium]
MASRSQQRSLPGLDTAATSADSDVRRKSASKRGPGSATPGQGETPNTVPAARENALATEPCDDLPHAVDIKGWNVYVVDAHSLIFQVFHAIPEMSSPRGEQVAAVFGFVRDMLYLIEEKKPNALICAFDLSGPTFRDQLYEAYKADRSEMPPDLSTQIPKIKRFLGAMSIPILTSEGFEADDVLATLARLCDERGANCFIVTGDKDCRQLITDRVAVFNIRKNQIFDATALREEWGVAPDQVVDFQALVGDKIDNVPGVPGIGNKTAQQLLETYGTLDNLLEHAAEVPGAKGKKLLECRDQALLSRQLVRLDTQVPITADWDASRVGDFDHPAVTSLFAEFGFRSFADRFAKLASAPTSTTASTAADANYQIVDTPEAFAALVSQLKEQTLISVDTETTHVSPRCAEIVGYSFAFKPNEAYYIPVRGPEGDRVLDPKTTLESLRPVLEDPNIRKLGQNLKYDAIVLRNVGVHLAGIAFDTMIANYLLDAGGRSHNLDDLAQKHLNHTTIKIDELIGKGRDQKRMDEVPVEKVGIYAAEDADIPLRMHALLQDRLDELELAELNDTVEVPLIEVLADIEFTGMRIDPARLGELSQRYGDRLTILEQEIEELAGHPLNIGSPKQLAQVLFQELGLPIVKRTKTGASTDADVLEQLADSHPLPKKIVEYRQYSKLKSTYVDALPTMIHPDTGRVHTSFNQVVAATGRLSSSDPNLQNIPIRTDEGREIRSAFISGEPGWKLLAADYSQIELRILAHYSEDTSMCAAFDRDEDIHTQVASQVFSVPLADVTSAQRRSAKAVNFGVIYGQSPFGLAKGLGISQDDAAKFIDGYFATYRGVAEFMVSTLDDCRRKGYVSTILGRRRSVQGVRPPDQLTLLTDRPSRKPLTLPERTAVNSVIQGSAADMIKLAMLAIHRRLKKEKSPARMLLQIHDELVFEAPESEIDSLAKLVRDEMQTVMALRVPLKVDVKSGLNWADCQPWAE